MLTDTSPLPAKFSDDEQREEYGDEQIQKSDLGIVRPISRAQIGEEAIGFGGNEVHRPREDPIHPGFDPLAEGLRGHRRLMCEGGRSLAGVDPVRVSDPGLQARCRLLFGGLGSATQHRVDLRHQRLVLVVRICAAVELGSAGIGLGERWRRGSL